MKDLYNRLQAWVRVCSFLLPLSTFLFSSCSDDGYESRLRELLLEDMTFSCEGGTQEQVFRHENLSAFTVSNKSSWCSPTLDANNCKLIVSVTANDTYDARTDTVTLTDVNNQATRYITVTQERRTGLFLDSIYFEVPMEGGSVTASLKSNVSYEVQIPDSCDWVTKVDTPSQTRGLEASSFTLNVSENKTYHDRDAIITVVNKTENLTDKLTIHQPFNTVFNVDSTAFEVAMEGEDFTVNIESNIPYDITIPDSCNWITKKSSGTRSQGALTRASETKAVTFSVKENKGYQARDGVITISNKEAGVSVEIKVHQPFTTVFNADKKSFEVPMEGGTVTINLESNVSYDVKIPDDCDWITRPSSSKTRATQTTAIELKVAENKTYKDREAVVVISNEEACAEVKVTISQPFTTTFKVDTNSFDVEMEGGNVTVNLESNISYDVTIPDGCDWITMPTASRRAKMKTRGTSTTAIVFRVSENNSYKDREGVITISNKDAGAEVKIYIHQKFTTTFTVDKTDAEVDMNGGVVTANVVSNIPYDVKIPSDCNWIIQTSGSRKSTRGSKTTALLFNVSANPTGRDRSATITIGNSSLGVSAALTIKQTFTAKFNVDATALEIDELGGTLGVSIAANVDVSVQALANWLSVGKKTNVGDGYWTQQIVVSKFTDKSAQRTGQVKFLYPAENQSVVVTVTQNRTLYITESYITLTEEGQTQALTLTNSQSKSVTWSSSDTKVATVSNGGLVKAVANGDAVITVKSADGKYSDTVKVTVDIPETVEEPTEEPTEESATETETDNSSEQNSSARVRKRKGK